MRPSEFVAAVVDIGATKIRIGTTSTSYDCTTVPTPTSRGQIIDTTTNLIKQLALDVDTIVIGCPGLISKKGVVEKALYIDLVGVDLKTTFEERFSLPTTVVNDATLQGMSFAPSGETVLYLALGTGVGGAIICDGKIVLGSHGFAGEIGHLPVPGNDRQCLCGRTGCIDTIASGMATATRLGIEWWRTPGKRHIDEGLREIGAACAQVANSASTLLDPELIVVAGHLAEYGSFQHGFSMGLFDKIAKLMFSSKTWPYSVDGARLAKV